MDYCKILKALGDETRLQIFDMLRNGSLCACKINEKFDLTQPTISHHLNVLCDSGIVRAVKEGKWVYYSLCCEKMKMLVKFFSDTKCQRECGDACFEEV